jgi:hypothetical protein
MISYLLLFLIPFFVSQPISSAVVPYQETTKTLLTGTVKDDENNSLPYVSVGIVNGETGTVTNEQGKFILQVKPEDQQGILEAKNIGYYFKSQAEGNKRGSG